MPYNSVTDRTDAAALIQEAVSGAMLNTLSEQSAALQLFNRISVPTNKTRFPVLTALPSAYFVDGDTGIKQTTEAAWSNKYLEVEEIAAIVPIPDAVLDDADYNLEAEIIPLVRNAIARTLDAAVFFGTNKPTSWPTGVAPAAIAAGNNFTRGTTTDAKGGVAEDMNQMNGTLIADGYSPTAYVANPKMQTILRSARATDGQMLSDINGATGSIWGAPTVYPMPGLWPNVATSGQKNVELIALQRENFIIGVRQDVTVTVSNQAVLMDATKAITYNLFQQDMTAFRVVFRVGWQVSNPLNYSEGTEANRYPAAVLQSPANP